MQERYNIPDTSARYLRVTVNGNSQNDLASILEMSVNGRECSIPQISGIPAIGNDGNIPQNTLDDNLNTRWSNLGFPDAEQVAGIQVLVEAHVGDARRHQIVERDRVGEAFVDGLGDRSAHEHLLPGDAAEVGGGVAVPIAVLVLDSR